MAQETELKLSIQPEQLIQLRQWLHQKNSLAPQVKRLENIYFDTPQRDLHQHKMALRLRCHGSHWLQTLKTAGKTTGALSERQEWEMPVAQAALELNRLPDGCLLDAWKMHLQPVFRTDFTRYTWLIEWPSGGALEEVTRIELAIDQGEVSLMTPSKAGLKAPLAELELECLAGPVSGLLAYAEQIAAQIALQPARVSKAQRGWWLAQPDDAPPTHTHYTKVHDVAQLEHHQLMHWASQALDQWMLTREYSHFSAQEDYLLHSYHALLEAQTWLTSAQWLVPQGSTWPARQAVRQWRQALQPWLNSYWRDQALQQLQSCVHRAGLNVAPPLNLQQMEYQKRRQEERQLWREPALGQAGLRLLKNLIQPLNATPVARPWPLTAWMHTAYRHLRFPHQPWRTQGWVRCYAPLVGYAALMRITHQNAKAQQQVDSMLHQLGCLAGFNQLPPAQCQQALVQEGIQRCILQLVRQAQALENIALHCDDAQLK